MLVVPRSRLERTRRGGKAPLTTYSELHFDLRCAVWIYSDEDKIITADFTVLYISEESQTPVIAAFALLALYALFTHRSTFNESASHVFLYILYYIMC